MIHGVRCLINIYGTVFQAATVYIFLSFSSGEIFSVVSRYSIDPWFSTFIVRVPPDVISLQLCTPKLIGI
jgi:hypothetical protein